MAISNIYRFEQIPGFGKSKRSTNCFDFHLFSSKSHFSDDVMYCMYRLRWRGDVVVQMRWSVTMWSYNHPS